MNRRGGRGGNISAVFSGAGAGGGSPRGSFRGPRGPRDAAAGGGFQISGRAGQDGDVEMLGTVAGSKIRKYASFVEELINYYDAQRGRLGWRGVVIFAGDFLASLFGAVNSVLSCNSRGNPYGGRIRSTPNQGQDIPVEISVRGWKGNADHNALFDFLRGKATGRFEILSHRFQNEDVFMKVRNATQASVIQRLNGIRYAGQKLNIQIRGSGPRPIIISAAADAAASSSAGATVIHSSVIEVLAGVLRSRYHPEIKYLKLDALGKEAAMMSNPALSGFGSDSLETSKLGPVICKMIGQLFPEVLTISFDSNNLTNLRPFQSLPSHVPLLQNLSFQDNLIQHYRDLEGVRGKDLPNLHELIFLSNPFREREIKKPGGEADYRRKIKDMYPSIRLLDRMLFAEEIGFDFAGAGDEGFGVTEKLSFVDHAITADLIQGFIVKFFSLFDKNRAGLVDLYADTALFSLSINQNSRRTGPNPPKHQNYTGWLSYNRNHNGPAKDTSKRDSLIAKGPHAIIQMFAKLPRTSHPTNFHPDKKLFVADGFQLTLTFGVVVVATIYGDFFQALLCIYADDINTNHSFTRTFTFIPAAPGSRHEMAGWPYSILNDQLVLRAWSPRKVWQEYAPSPQSAVPTSGTLVGDVNAGTGARRAQSAGAAMVTAPSAPSGIVDNGIMSLAPSVGVGVGGGPLPDAQGLMALKSAHGLNDMQHNLVLQFSQTTGLNYQFSFRCLTELQWNGDAALQAFNGSRPNIPPEAFQFMGLAPMA
ncbi:nuclear mRNA export, poly(A)+RNA binding protein [Dinochytrium kinnereticum]|nr:nuclear mRNA export, poly(A)+RNA binding protein [Dinochytrium kinnereticum]